MNRYASEQLMTVEEAQRLSGLDTRRDERRDRPAIWAWQTVAGVLAQTVTEEQVERAVRAKRQR
jgi:hypothetical protein